MLLELKVSDFAIIESVHISFKPGLNILSGETGAGKSVLLKSLALLMGAKALSGAVRQGTENAVIEGCFEIKSRPDIQKRLQEMGIQAQEDLLVVRRIVSAQGKSRVYLNGSLSTINDLRDIVAPLVEVTGHAAPLIEMTAQHETRHLLSKAYHLDLLDQYCGAWKPRLEYHELYNRWKTVETEIEEHRTRARERAQRLDFLIYQRNEIESLDLQIGEEQEIENQVKSLRNMSRITEFQQSADDVLLNDEDSALNRIHRILQKAHELGRFDHRISEIFAPLDQSKVQIEDALYELTRYVGQLESDPDQLNRYEERLSKLRQLQKKFGASVEEILGQLDQIRAEITTLEGSEEKLQELEKEEARLRADLKKRAEDLHRRRVEGAKLLGVGVNEELKSLNMKGLKFLVQVEKTEEIQATGASDVEFLTQISKSAEPRPLAKFASGGELSRILLSIKQIAGSQHYPRTYLFDEVDTGVSGETAQKVGRKLKDIAQGQQVICVTHLPQVAAFGDVHFYIEKSSSRGDVVMEVHELKKDDRVKEIGRLISGEKISSTSLAHAKQLLADCR